MPSFKSAGAALAVALPVALAGTHETCPNTSSVLSCSGSSSNTCCISSPYGLIQQVQFWDTDPVTGPDDSWTIHGLWPNNCDGSYNQNCDSSRAYKDITTLLKNAGQSALVTYMDTYWQSNDESGEAFWEHEWATHGTCYSTLEPSCYTDYSTGDEAVDFFVATVGLFKTLPTYEVSKESNYFASVRKKSKSIVHANKLPSHSGSPTPASPPRPPRHTACPQ